MASPQEEPHRTAPWLTLADLPRMYLILLLLLPVQRHLPRHQRNHRKRRRRRKRRTQQRQQQQLLPQQLQHPLPQLQLLLPVYIIEASCRRQVMKTLPILLALCEVNPPFTGGFPSQRASYVELCCFLCCCSEQVVEQSINFHWFETPWCSRGVTMIRNHVRYLINDDQGVFRTPLATILT